MRTGAAGVIVGVGADSFSTGDAVMGIRVPLASAIADAAAARRDYLDETGGRYVHVIANGRIETSGAIARALACGADAVQLGEPLRVAAEAPGGGIWWDSVAAHPRLPRGGASAPVEPLAPLEQVLLGPAATSDGRTNLFGALRAHDGEDRLPRPQGVPAGRPGHRRLRRGVHRRPGGLMDFPTVLVVDFGAQYAQLIARRIREAGVYSEIVSSEVPADEVLARKPAAIVLSGGPSSVYAPGAPQVDPALFEAGVPAFGICYGFQAMAPEPGRRGRPHRRPRVRRHPADGHHRRAGCSARCPSQQSVWMSHGDAVSQAPPGFTVTATSTGAPVAAFEDVDRKLAGVQFHPEVRHTAHGQSVLEHFLFDIAGLEPTWTMANVVEEQVERIRAQVGDGRALCALSGGRRLRRRRGARAAGDRRPAHLRLRRPRADARGRDRADRAGLRRRHRGGPAGGRRPRAVPHRAGRGLRPRGEAQDHRPGVHPGLRAGRARRRRRRQGARRDRRLPRAGHALPRRRRVRRRHRDGEHQEPPQRRRPARGPASSPWSSRCGRCSRTRSARSASSSGCPRRWSGASRSPGPGSASGSSAR